MNVVEIYRDNYQPLFEIEVTHNYFLKKFYFNANNQLKEDTSPTTRESLLKFYNVADFFDIQPTKACKNILKGQRLLFRKTATGFMVLAWQNGNQMPQIPLSDDTTFEFTISLRDKNFFNYTTLPLDGLPYVLDNGLYYRSTYFFSNNLPTGQAPYLTAGGTVATVADRVSSNTYDVGPNDIGLISIQTKNSSANTNYDLLDGTGQLNSPTFQLRFLARRIRWRYRNQTSLVGVSGALPLSKAGINPILLNGNLAYLPSAGVNKIDYPAGVSNPTNNQLYSTIYLSG